MFLLSFFVAYAHGKLKDMYVSTHLRMMRDFKTKQPEAYNVAFSDNFSAKSFKTLGFTLIRH